ncbi:TIGR02444 family protein [Brevundimonas balnearis]|uniref:TIGR02444 family protein n=1 Tax=Brevundimonas balnearis TaxID=1572858 RepID=A0ABV6R2K1_9CAUL
MTDLWSWALEAYAAEGVQEACLALQDSADQDVPLLLWAAWAARSGRPLDEDALEAACDLARAWRERAVGPLRAVRRGLKVRHPDLDDAAREAVRAQVKAAELAAERALLEGLEAQSPPSAGPPLATLDALIAASRAWSARVPRALLQTLAERLPD